MTSCGRVLALLGVLFRGDVELVALRGVRAALAFGFVRLLREALVGLHVSRGCQQDRLGVVTQGELCHVRP